MLTQEHLGYSFVNSAEQIDKHRAIRDGFKEMIESNGPWDLWVSITFFEPRNYKSARRAFKKFMRKLNSNGEYLISNFVFCFVLYEINPDRDGVHIHALIRGIPALYAQRFEERCGEALGNARIAPYRPSIQPNATLYLANKYVSGRMVDFQFMKIDPRKRKNSLMSRTKIQL